MNIDKIASVDGISSLQGLEISTRNASSRGVLKPSSLNSMQWLRNGKESSNLIQVVVFLDFHIALTITHV